MKKEERVISELKTLRLRLNDIHRDLNGVIVDMANERKSRLEIQRELENILEFVDHVNQNDIESYLRDLER